MGMEYFPIGIDQVSIHNICIEILYLGSHSYCCLNLGSFAGGFRNGKKHGCGVFTWLDGTKTIREYQNDVLVAGITR
jgi:hypothetical protein